MHDPNMHILHPLRAGTRARREILQDLAVWRPPCHGAHQGRGKRGLSGTADPDWSGVGSRGNFPGIHGSALHGSSGETGAAMDRDSLFFEA
jgi:hypothetical protein